MTTLLALLPACETVPAGPFLMGTPDSERSGLAKRYGGTRESYAEESPQHQVDLAAFAIMRVPVTCMLYEQWVREADAPPPVTWRDGQLMDELRDHPVTDVNWDDALAFAAWLRGKTGVEWDLPDEAQWEKAARGIDGRLFPWGDVFEPELCNVREAGRSGTSPVGAYPDGASPYGVLDMAGNIWEWTRSLQAPYPYVDDGRNQTTLDDARSSLWGRALARLRRRTVATPQPELRRVLRGGCYANPQGFARCACRFRLPPASRTPFLGFRLVHPV